MTLNCYEVLSCESRKSPEYKVVEQLVNTLSLSDPDNGIISLQANADDWSVYVIRHKKRKTYLMDNKHILTVTVVQECKLSHQPVVELTPDLYSEPHTEIEVYNIMYYAFQFSNSNSIYTMTPTWMLMFVNINLLSSFTTVAGNVHLVMMLDSLQKSA